MQAGAFSPFLDKSTMALTVLLIPGFSDFESYIFNTQGKKQQQKILWVILDMNVYGTLNTSGTLQLLQMH